MMRLLLVAAFSWTATVHAGPLEEAAVACNAFSFAAMEKTGAGKDNLVFSPFSVWSALAMTAAGAEGETLDEMRQVLALPADAAKAPAAEWSTRLNSTRGVEMTVANRLWGRKGLSFRREFVKLTESRYGAGLEALDFAADAEGSRHHINQWVSGKTGRRISNLLGPGVLDRDTQLVLTNAVYFHGRWMTPFEPRATARREFTPASGQKVKGRGQSLLLTVAGGRWQTLCHAEAVAH